MPGLIKFDPNMMIKQPNGNFQCTFCGIISTSATSARVHVIRMHIVPEIYQCKLCGQIIKHRIDFQNHIIKKHKMRGAKNVANVYATRIE